MAPTRHEDDARLRRWRRRVTPIVLVVGVSTAGLSGQVTAASDSSNSPPTTIHYVDRGASVPAIWWTSTEIRVRAGARGGPEPSLLECNGVQALPDDPWRVVLPPADSLDLACSLSNGDTIAISVPGVTRDGEGLTLTHDGTSFLAGCIVDPPVTSITQEVFVDTWRLECPLENADVEAGTGGRYFGVGTLFIEACPTMRGQQCAPIDDRPSGAVPATTEAA